MPRNPPWNRDELILALELYLESHNVARLQIKDQGIIDLSIILNRLSENIEKPDADKYRNPNSVHMKLQNFLSIDPNYEGEGLKAGSRLDKIIWDEFNNDRERLRIIAAAIKRNIQDPEIINTSAVPIDDDYEAPEGKLLMLVHRHYERDPGLIRKKKKLAYQQDKMLKCEICGFSYKLTYGDIGDGIIDCHHIIPLSSIQPNQITKLQDLILVCSNCHRILHKGGDKINITSLIALFSIHNNY